MTHTSDGLSVIDYLDADPEAKAALYAAARAPSLDHLRPWHFRVTEDRITVLRTGMDGPPITTEQLLSCGAAIFNLRIALRVAGRASSTRLLPQERMPNQLATVTFTGPATPAPTETALYRAISHWRPGWVTFGDRPVPLGVIALLLRAAHLEGVQLRLSQDESPLGAQLVSRTGKALEQLRLGQALQRVLLTAEVAGVRTTFECELDARARSRMVLRFGYPVGAEPSSVAGAATPNLPR